MTTIWFSFVWSSGAPFQTSKTHRGAAEDVPKHLQEPLGDVKGRRRNSEGGFESSKSHQRAPAEPPRAPKEHLGSLKGPPERPQEEQKVTKY